MAANKTDSRRAGVEQERAIVRYAHANGYDQADRTIRTGAGSGYSVRADKGDIDLCPGVIVQSKRLHTNSVNDMELAVPKWMAETSAQTDAARADFGLLIVGRKGITDVGRWWCFLTASSFDRLMGERGHGYGPTADLPNLVVRLQVADVFQLLRASGYGTPITGEVAA